MTPKVSVIVPVYNVEKYLEQCLDSIFEQTLSPIEVICINDGSTDSSPEILKRYAEEYENLRIIHKENGGLSSARNVGLDAAQGEYLLFIDSDDWMDAPNSVEELYDRAVASSLDLLFFSAKVYYESDAARAAADIKPQYYCRKGSYPSVMSGPALFRAFCENGDFRVQACMILYRRDFIVESGLRFPEGIIHEDEVSTPEYLALAERASYLSAPYYGRRIRENSILTSAGTLRKCHGYCMGAQALSEFYQARLSTADPRFKRCFRQRVLGRIYHAGTHWISTPRSDRKSFLQSLPKSERSVMKKFLCIAVPRAHIRQFRRTLRNARKQR